MNRLQKIHDSFQFLIGIIFDLYSSFIILLMIYCDLGSQDHLDFLFDSLVNELILCLLIFFVFFLFLEILHQPLSLPDAEFFIKDLVCQIVLLLLVPHGQKGSRMAGGNLFIHHHLLHPLIQFEKTHGIGNCGTALGNPLCQLVLLQIKLGQKTFEGHRFLDGVQVFPLNV